MLCTSSSVLHKLQDQFAASEMESIVEKDVIPVIAKHYDTTPSKVRFGRLQSLLLPLARYAVLKDDGQWSLVSHEEYVKTKIKGRQFSIKQGVLDIITVSASLIYMDTDSTLHGFRYFSRPAVIAAGNASCIFRATEQLARPFDLDCIRRLCANVRFMFYTEVPDGHSANDRKKEKTKQLLPDNCGFVESKCSGHQAERIIQGKEKRVVGNVHAVCMTCGHVTNQNRLQGKLMELLQELDYNIGDPDPISLKHNKSVLVHTILRGDAYGKGSIHNIDIDKVDLTEFPAVQKFYEICNGDWRRGRVSFFTAGRDIGRNEAMSLMFGAIIEIGVLQPCVGTSPSIDDWLSTGKYAGRTSLGIMFNNLLYRVIDSAMPDWGAMLPPNDRGGCSVDGASLERIKIQRKAWRTKCFLRSIDEQENCVLLSYIGIAIEHLLRRLDYLDARGKGLFDVAIPRLCPFRACRRLLFSFVKSEFKEGSPLWSVYRHFNDGTVEYKLRLMGKVQTMSWDMAAQVHWRFANLQLPPFSLVQCVNPGVPPEQRPLPMQKVYEADDCCNDDACTLKIKALFPSWQEALRVLSPGLMALGVSFKFGDMISERLLARLRQACGGNIGAFTVEDICSRGFISQLLGEHLRLGRDNPRLQTNRVHSS